ncbi:hypothetical protein HK097_003914 [Rhizophlyctis rosea]|uniref:Short-chain dehydrogenase n=1 Tax=Rhizophlyctis rosea TaxID=64517 RepID=A0AAD5SFS0_9FUNG|nr:hypothetical protein HK097_003914 [Rhizophlyctis rosea]
MNAYKSVLFQSFWIPAPTFTETELPDQTGKIHIVTGGYAGCGFQLVRFLYQKNATVYVAGRSKEKADSAIRQIMEEFGGSKGRLEFLKVDFSDFTTIKPAVEEYTSKETRLDVLTNNAGVMTPPVGSKDAHGHELQMGTNCIGHYLFTKLLIPILRQTASSPSSPPGSVRVTWGSSSAMVLTSPTDGVQFDPATGAPKVHGVAFTDYGQSKAGDFFLATEFARRLGPNGTESKNNIVSVAWNPGNLKTELQRHSGGLAQLLTAPLVYPAKMGGYTELYAGWSPEVGLENSGDYVVPWGRLDTQNLRADLLRARDGGVASKFWEWCDAETRQFA